MLTSLAIAIAFWSVTTVFGHKCHDSSCLVSLVTACNGRKCTIIFPKHSTWLTKIVSCKVYQTTGERTRVSKLSVDSDYLRVASFKSLFYFHTKLTFSYKFQVQTNGCLKGMLSIKFGRWLAMKNHQYVTSVLHVAPLI